MKKLHEPDISLLRNRPGELGTSIAQKQKKVLSADKLAQAKIDQMFRKTHDLVNVYLDPVVIEQLERQLREARGAGPLSPFSPPGHRRAAVRPRA